MLKNRIKKFGGGPKYKPDASDIQSGRIAEGCCPKCGRKMMSLSPPTCSNAICAFEIHDGYWGGPQGYCVVKKTAKI